MTPEGLSGHHVLPPQACSTAHVTLMDGQQEDGGDAYPHARCTGPYSAEMAWTSIQKCPIPR